MLVRRHRLAGRHAMRISVSSWANTETDVDRSLQAILRIALMAGPPAQARG